MKQGMFDIVSQEPLTETVYRVVLRGDTSAVTAPGQFVNLKLEGLFLRRPISVCDYDAETVTLVYKVVGRGTEQLRRMRPGETLSVLTGLGNGFDVSKSGETPLLIGGGVGTPPLYRLCRELTARGCRPTVILGFATAAEVFYEEEFRALGAAVYVTTADGSYGQRGFVTDAMEALQYSFFYACGPEPMFRAIHRVATAAGEYSFEERMGCGFGACMGCSCRTLTGFKRICKAGPVMESEEILWND